MTQRLTLPLGSRVRSLRDFSSVPSGTTGTIVDLDQALDDYVIEWDRPEDVRARGGRKARIGPQGRSMYERRLDGLRDWFTPTEAADFLEVIR